MAIGFARSDTADFSGLSKPIKIEVLDTGWTYVDSRHKKSDFFAVLDKVEKIVGTDYKDIIFTDGNLRDIRTGKGDDKVIGGAERDVIRLGEGNDNGRGGAGDDFVSGGDGDDRVSGGDGNDRVYGDSGNDMLWGGAGDDDLYGGKGDDIMKGNSGADTFIFMPGRAGSDTIIGFSMTHDSIQFERGDLTFEDLQAVVVGDDLVMSYDNGRTDGQITLANRADEIWDMTAEIIDQPDWLVFL